MMVSGAIPSTWLRPERIVVREGVRGVGGSEVQLVCGAGPYELDVLVCEHPDSPRLRVVGQITLGGRIYEPVSDLGLSLVAAAAQQASSADTRTDDFGEFDLASCASDEAYGLRLGDRPDSPCVLVWEGA